MPKIVFIEHNGKEHVVEARVGQSIMQAALENSVPGILADCGGSLACGSCQGYVDPQWMDKFKPRSSDEVAMLEAGSNLKDNSRLTCQLSMREDLDGIVVRLPESQY
jgi:ferredoxin, 2Fe-2S